MSDPFALSPTTAAFIHEIQQKKYMQKGEQSWSDTLLRVTQTFFAGYDTTHDRPVDDAIQFRQLLENKIITPAGRILAGAGTARNVTMFNCFISPLLQDSMRTDPSKPGKGIMDALADVAYSMQMGGGVGTDFSPLRPEGALVQRLMAPASGPLAFMDMWDAMCRTVMSAGDRRGAMMATLMCDHPDIMAFITAKHDPRRLRMFNVSVLVTDAFMNAVSQDLDWGLGHWERPFEREAVNCIKKYDPYSKTDRDWYVYEIVKARKIWDAIMQSTYEHAEPGVIFIDRVNQWNNLHYYEHVQSTNPCGEQAMAPDNTCNLWHINLSRCITGTPFSDDCAIDYGMIERATRLLVRAGDRLIDLSRYPTSAQEKASKDRRRIGIGITGLANLFMFHRYRYGSPLAVEMAEGIMSAICLAAYDESCNLARNLGAFPAYDKAGFQSSRFVRERLPDNLKRKIREYGMRNALLLSVAPTGTTSIGQCDNSSGGLEPVFALRYNRKVLERDGSYSHHQIEDFGFRVFANVVHGGDTDAAYEHARQLPFMATTNDLAPIDHLRIQAAIQKWVDNSVSKTINVPTDISFDEFKEIYAKAYIMNCKGCTTYRDNPESGRGAVLSVDQPKVEQTKTIQTALSAMEQIIDSAIGKIDALTPRDETRKRPDMLEGRTYRLRWGGLPFPMFFTINDEIRPDGSRVPFEVFINSKAVENNHWISALTRMISAVMRKGGDLTFIPDELKQVWSARGGEFHNQAFVPSEVALIGQTLERHFREIGYLQDLPVDPGPTPPGAVYAETGIGEQCPSCGSLQVIREQGCKRCITCGWSNCG